MSLVLIAGNWKMFKGPREAAEFCCDLRELDLGDVDVVVCPPSVSLSAAVQALADTDIAVAAQNVHGTRRARSRERSPRHAEEVGVHDVIIGHSERRQSSVSRTSWSRPRWVTALLPART